MEAVGYLLRLRSAERRPFGIKTTTISRNRHDFGMMSEPFRKAVRGPVREKVDNVAEFHIDQNRSVLLAFAPSPVIDTQVPNGAPRRIPHRLLPNASQNSVIAGGNG